MEKCKKLAFLRYSLYYLSFFLYFFVCVHKDSLSSQKKSIDKNKERYFSLFFPYSYLLMFSLLWYCLPDSYSLPCYNPETSSQVTLALLGIAFQANLIRSIRWIRGRMKTSEVMCVFFSRTRIWQIERMQDYHSISLNLFCNSVSLSMMCSYEGASLYMNPYFICS